MKNKCVNTKRIKSKLLLERDYSYSLAQTIIASKNAGANLDYILVNLRHQRYN